MSFATSGLKCRAPHISSDSQAASGRARPALYAELVDYALNFLHLDEDKRSLTNCSLVCKLWADCAARHIISIMVLDPTALIWDASGVVPAHFALRQHPRVTWNVRGLKLETKGNRWTAQR